LAAESFTMRDGERTIRFGEGSAAEAPDLLQMSGFGKYALLTTERAEASAPLDEDATQVVHVPPGLVDEISGILLPDLMEVPLVALGGGRVIDTAKAIGGVTGLAVAAIPTTLSGAELTPFHRTPAGVEGAHMVRPSLVVADPLLMASQPATELAASAMNALGHAFEAPCTVRANPVATLAAHEAARRLHGAFGRPGEIDRDGLALGALLAGYALGSTGIGLHHVLAQTLVRHELVGHGAANAIMLPHTIGALARRFPEEHAALTVTLGEEPAAAAARVCALTGATRLRDVGVREEDLDACADTAAARQQLDDTPPRAGWEELRSLYGAAW
jgi:alcohol dehydrogenase class IV